MTTPTFKNLWPTRLMEIALPGHDQANPVLADHIESLDLQKSQMTTDYLTDNLFDEQHPAIQWLKQSAQRAVADYAQNLGIDYGLDFAIQAWANVNRMGDYHNLHNHPHAWLSGTYYVMVPEQDTLPAGRDDRTPNCISFYDPRPQANMNAIRGMDKLIQNIGSSQRRANYCCGPHSCITWYTRIYLTKHVFQSASMSCFVGKMSTCQTSTQEIAQEIA